MKYLGFSRIRAGKDTHGAKRRQWLYVKNPNNKFLHGNELPTIGKI
jgi:hypothetical protein